VADLPELELPERRTRGLLRVPYVRRCFLEFADGQSDEGFTVNLNVMGAYVARDALAREGEGVALRFGLPDSEHHVVAKGVVVWINSRQQHPVHSLPVGFGMKFTELGEEDRARIERLVASHVASQQKR
jgi:Tfp pilus assembly protein PilZ